MGGSLEKDGEICYNRAVIRGVDYFINNLKVNKSLVTDKNEGFPKTKSESLNRKTKSHF